jgi:dihydrofolate reductase
MRKLIVSTYVTLDGVMTLDGGMAQQWHFPFFNDELAKYSRDQLFAADALLLGRRTYDGFAATWPSVTDEQGFADRMNHLPKYVVSTTLATAEATSATRSTPSGATARICWATSAGVRPATSTTW